MLATGTAGAVGIHTHIIHVDFHLYRIIQLRHNITGAEGSMTACRRVKWRNAHKTVHSLLRLQKSVGIMPLDKEGS